MATLSKSRKELVKKRKIRLTILMVICGIVTFPYLSLYILKLLENRFNYKEVNITIAGSFLSLIHNKAQLHLLLILFGILGLLLFMMLTSNLYKVGRTDTVHITDKIETPVAVGEGQHGTSRFMTEEEKREEFYVVEYNKKKPLHTEENLGLIIGMVCIWKKEIITCIADDIHTLLIGATRSGKSRRAILQSIWLRSVTGNSMIINDPKGELYLYTGPYLRAQGYETIDFDLRQPLKSMHHNYLIFIINAVSEGDIPQAIDYTWDLVSVLVGIPKGEPLWTNGESAVIAASILAVVMEATERFQNFTNVYAFIANMCKPDPDAYDEMPITAFFNNLPDNHPAKMVFAVAEISPEKMRGSFFGSALATLRLFTNWNISEMTSKSDFDIKSIGQKKTALFIIIPDEKPTLYPLASLFISQSYVALVEVANQCGGRLPVPVDYYWDEFGQCPPIPGLGSMLSVGAGRGIRFNLVLQDFQQLESKYKEESDTIKGNCQVWIYLKTPTQKTLEELSKKTGTYTVQSNSANSSVSGGRVKNDSYSDNASMQSRPLLFPDEVGRIDSPFSLVLYSGKFPSIFETPDLSKFNANKLFGLGNKKHNLKIYMERDNARAKRESTIPELWGIWKQDNSDKQVKDQEGERLSFLDL